MPYLVRCPSCGAPNKLDLLQWTKGQWAEALAEAPGEAFHVDQREGKAYLPVATIECGACGSTWRAAPIVHVVSVVSPPTRLPAPLELRGGGASSPITPGLGQRLVDITNRQRQDGDKEPT